MSDNLFHNYNDGGTIDVGCGEMIPKGNLDPNQPGSYAYMKNELDGAYKNNDNFKAETPTGFRPCFTTKGLEGLWGLMTKPKK